jgi:predicted nucleotidyltransferase
MNDDRLLGVVMFGSTARGDDDCLSDLDVLAIVRNHSGRISEQEVRKHIPAIIAHRKPTVSWYGFNRLHSMYEEGELFAWHIFLEGKILHGKETIISLGEPSTYRTAMQDIKIFCDTMHSVPRNLRHSQHNAIYELGVLYVCVRNIAMSASWHLSVEPDFSRYSPFNFGEIEALCPITREAYERSMACRAASQRGSKPPDGVRTDEVSAYYDSVAPWATKLQLRVQKEIGCGAP